MCGITGRLALGGHRVTSEEIRRMSDRIAHRGPDDAGVYVNERGTMGLGHRRLAIIDLSPAGHQPMSNEDGTVWIVFNGEIYNFLDLRPELERRGHTFRSQTDTETIVHLWEELGVRCVERLRGMFAFAIWDARKQQLFLARDRVGKKPLKYALTEHGITFASELKAFLGEPGIPAEVDLEAIHAYLTYQYVPHPMTGFRGVAKLPPAHSLLVEVAGDTVRTAGPTRYWHLDYTRKLQVSIPEWRERILACLDECVRIRMVADVPIGAFLSGGVDSSAVVAFMARHSTQPVKTFSIGFRESTHNELPYARAVAERYATEHTEFIVEPNAIEALPNLVAAYEEPYADSSALPTSYVSKLTREHVTVALNGDGGDENFAGYPWYRVHLLAGAYGRIPRALQRLILSCTRAGARRWPTTAWSHACRFARGVGETAAERYLRYLAYFHPDELAPLMTDAFRHAAAPWRSEEFLLRQFRRVEGVAPLDQALYTDIHSYLPDDLLVKVDIASMAVALEARSPLLDHTFLELTAQIPSNLKLRHGELKYVFKRALDGIVPHENLYRRKMGFGVPIAAWFRGPLRTYLTDVLTDPGARTRSILRRDAVDRLIHDHVTTSVNHAPKLWALLTLELWWRQAEAGVRGERIGV